MNEFAYPVILCRGEMSESRSLSDFSTRTLVLPISSLAAIAVERSSLNAHYFSVWNRR